MGQYIGFNLGREEYAIPILMVQEIMKPTQATKLPHTPDYVIGIINLRGKTISVLNLKSKLGLNENGLDGNGNGNVIVVNIGRMTFGALVDSITGVMNVDETLIKSDIGFVGTSVDECLRGVVNLDENRMVLLLDFMKLLNNEDVSLFSDDIVSSIRGEDGKVEITRKISSIGGDLFVKEVKEVFEKNAAEKGLEKEIVKKIMSEVQTLIDAFANGNIETAEKSIEALSSYGEKEIFSEVGKVTRKLHDSLRDFKLLIDPTLKTLAEDQMPEATDKLEWVITKTGEAASQTITIAEKNQTRIEVLQSKIQEIESRISESEDLKKCFPESDLVLLSSIRSEMSDVSNDFLEIMLAQEFQDLTGQILKKVINLVRQLEDELVRLVMVFGVKVEPAKKPEAEKTELAGPQIKAAEGVFTAQGDVDSLLSEFGF